VRALDVVFGEFKRVPKRIIDVTLRGEVQNDVDAFAHKDVIQEIDRSNVPFDKCDVQERTHSLQVF